MKVNPKQANTNQPTLVIAFSGVLFLVMLFYFTDSIFFNEKYFNDVRQHYQVEFAVGLVVMLVSFTISIIYYATKRNEQAMDSYYAAQEEMKEIAYEYKNISIISKDFFLQAQAFADQDAFFNRLWLRYTSYLKFSKGERHDPKQLIDFSGNPNLALLSMSTIWGPGICVFFVLSFNYVLKSFIKYNYESSNLENPSLGRSFSDIFTMAQTNSPDLFLLIVIFTIIVGVLCIYVYLKLLLKNTFTILSLKSVYVGNENKPTYSQWLMKKNRVYNISWQVLFSVGFMIGFYIPLATGLLLFDVTIISISCVGEIVGLLLILFDENKNNSFQVSDSGWVRKTSSWKKPIDISLSDCKNIYFYYVQQRIRYRSILDLFKPQFPLLIPDQIYLEPKEGKGIYLQLRHLMNENKQTLDSHAVEFYFAFLLKSLGFQFEVPENDELAGDWRAVNPGLLS